MPDGPLRWVVLAAVTGACSGVSQATIDGDVLPHYGEDWLRFRAEGLRISVEEAAARDAAMSEDQPPASFWDPQTGAEAAALWRDLCASCHGPNGDPDEAPQKVEGEAPRSWAGMGPSMGFFFGGDGMRAGLYRRIHRGGDQDGNPSEMPAWGEMLSKEQIWALVRHIEGF